MFFFYVHVLGYLPSNSSSRCLIVAAHFSAGAAVTSRAGTSFDVRFKGDLEDGQSNPPTPRASISTPDESYNAAKTYLPMRLANLQDTYHDEPVNNADPGSLPTDAGAGAEAPAQDTKAEVLMEANPNFAPRSYAEPQLMSWSAKLWNQLRIWLGKAQRALLCIRQKAGASKGPTFSKPLPWWSTDDRRQTLLKLLFSLSICILVGHAGPPSDRKPPAALFVAIKHVCRFQIQWHCREHIMKSHSKRTERRFVAPPPPCTDNDKEINLQKC